MSVINVSNHSFSIDELFNKLKQRSQLRSRSLPHELINTFVVTDSDKTYFTDNINAVVFTDIANRMSVSSQIRVDGSYLRISLDQAKYGTDTKRFLSLLEDAILSMLLAEWSRGVGIGDLYQEYMTQAEKRIEQFKFNIGAVVTVKRTPLSF